MAFDDHVKGRTNWVSNVKSLLCENGFGYIWEFPEKVDFKTFLAEFKQRLIDNFVRMVSA